MIEAIKNAFKLPDLKKKILFTLAMIAIYRFGAHVPVPGVDPAKLEELFKTTPLLGFLDIFAGGALSRFAVFALGIMPYITASIIMQLLTIVIPTLERWSKEGEAGQRKITQWTRYLTLALGLLESVGYISLFQAELKLRFAFGTQVLIVVTLVAGTALIMWLGELITQRGIGNGMSLLIFASIIARLPEGIVSTYQTSGLPTSVLLMLILLAVIVAIIFIEQGQRRIPVQYAKRVVGRKVYGGGSTFIPLKVNSSGVIPIIFASALLAFPATIAKFIPNRSIQDVADALGRGSGIYIAVEAMLIIFFAYFYTAIIFNPIDIADNLKKYGGFVPGVRPGKPTAVFIDRVLTRITLPGAIFIALVAVLPTILLDLMNVPFFRNFGGTSLLIMVGVALETMRQLETQLLMRHYEGFLK